MQNIAKQVHVLHIYYHNRSTVGQYLQLYFKNRVIQYNCKYICVNSTNNKNDNNFLLISELFESYSTEMMSEWCYIR